MKVGQKSNLGNSLLLASNKTKECAKHTKESDDGGNKGDTRFRVALPSGDRVRTCESDELERLVSEELDGTLGEGDFI
jgi:hypothetical protein